MSVSVRISWDEENNPRPFYFCWGVCQLLLLVTVVLLRMHILKSVIFLAPGNGLWIRSFGFMLLISLLATGSLYLNLMMNAIWHRNPDLGSETNEDEDSDQPMSHFTSSQDNPDTPKIAPGLFDQSVLKSSDPIILRDQIQWQRMGISTLAIGTMILALVLLV
jgi:hypothetical protein